MKGDVQTLQVEVSIAQAKRQRRTALAEKAPEPLRIPRITRLMALAIKFQDMVDLGEVRDYADLARLGYVSRARITQIMNLLNLAPEIQSEILELKGAGRFSTMRESQFRPLAALIHWDDQRHRWHSEWHPEELR